MDNKLQLTTEEKGVIAKNFFPVNATKQDMAFCMNTAYQFGLNPLLNQIYFVSRKSKVNNQWLEKIVPMVGRGGFLTIAHKSGKFAGVETTTEVKEIASFEGNEWITKRDLTATSKVYRSDTERPFVVEVNYSEYVQTDYSGKVTKFWREKPLTMLKKVAESQALRLAFDVSGIYIEEEINDQATTVTATATEPKKDDLTDLLTNDLKDKNVNIVTGEVLDTIPEDQIEAVLNEEAVKQDLPYELEID